MDGWEEVASREDWEGAKIEGNVILQGKKGVASLIPTGVLEEGSWIDWGGRRRKVVEGEWNEEGQKEEIKRDEDWRREGRRNVEEENRGKDRGIGDWEDAYVGGEEEIIMVGGRKGVGILWRGDEKEGRMLEIKEGRREGGKKSGIEWNRVE